MKLTVHLVTWNGARYVSHLFESLRKQTMRDWKLYIYDNASNDGMVERMEQEIRQFPVPVELIKNTENSGFAPGHNFLYKKTEAEYFVLLNQDMYLQPDCLERMVEFLDANPKAAAVSPRLMKWLFKEIEQIGFEKSLSTQIDALGLKIFRNRRVIEQYTQQEWKVVRAGFTKNVLPVFGVSGAFPMYRRSAIDVIAFSDGTMFDETYHSYKEDVDLAYRLAARGSEAYVILDSVAHHDRGGAGPKESDDMSAAINKKTQSSWVKYHSYKNHLRTLYKNEYWQNFLFDLPWIVWYEFKKFMYFVLFDRSVLKGLSEIWHTRHDLRLKRREIVKGRAVAWWEVRKWWTEIL